ncbi:MAG: sulfurtransferase-like selenium metabolism protein YedF [Coriobacteriia bacterium]|nr:sulfurtransferase-like selenium metabolism protein YedF [Coriobacteriia bacterium]
MKVVFINSECIGEGDDELGRKLMGSFLYSLARTEPKPDVIGLMNGAVRLACEGSPALDDLRLLADDGVRLFSCGTCLDWFGLKERFVVGEIGAMNDAAALFMEADSVVSVG